MHVIIIEVSDRNGGSCCRRIKLHNDDTLIRHVQAGTGSRKPSLVFKLMLPLTCCSYDHESIGMPAPNSIGCGTLAPYSRLSGRYIIHYEENRLRCRQQIRVSASRCSQNAVFKTALHGKRSSQCSYE